MLPKYRSLFMQLQSINIILRELTCEEDCYRNNDGKENNVILIVLILSTYEHTGREYNDAATVT